MRITKFRPFLLIPICLLLLGGCRSETGNSGEEEMIAHTDPPFSTPLTLLAPLQQYVRGSVLIELESGNSAGEIACQFDQQQLTDSDPDPRRFRSVLDSELYADGEHRLNCQTQTSQGQPYQLERWFMVDNSPAIIQWQINGAPPRSPAIYGGTLDIYIEASDLSPPLLFQMTSDDPLLLPLLPQQGQGSELSFSLPTAVVYPQQAHALSISVTVTDRAGNQAISSLPFALHNEPPTIIVHRPTTDQIVHGTVRIELEVVSPLPIDELQVSLVHPGGSNALANSIPTHRRFEHLLDTTTYIDSWASLDIVSRDNAGHSQHHRQGIGFNNQPFDSVIHFNTGPHNGHPAHLFGVHPVDYAQHNLLVEDFDGDGEEEIHFGRNANFFSGSGSHTLTMRSALQATTGMVGPWENHLSTVHEPIAGTQFGDFVGCDLNNDGIRDGAWLHRSFGSLLGRSLPMIIGRGPLSIHGQWQQLQQITSQTGNDGHLSCLDLNGDQRDDLVLADRVYFAPGMNAQPFPQLSFGHRVGDLNGDNLADISMVDERSATLHIAYGGFHTPSQLQRSPTLLSGVHSGIRQPETAAMGDVNGDGFGDFIVMQPTRLHLYFGQSATTTLPTEQLITLPQSSMATHFHGALAAADFSGDGFVDLVVTVRSSQPTADRLFLYYGPDYRDSVPLLPPAHFAAQAEFGHRLAVYRPTAHHPPHLVVLSRNALPGIHGFDTEKGELSLYYDGEPSR